jgi:hypothetical protein
MSWNVNLFHCPGGTPDCHVHFIQTFNGSSGSFAAADHEYQSYYELKFTVTDSGGLSDEDTVLVYPELVNFSLQSTPSGLRLAVNGIDGVTPFTRPAIVGSTNALSAPSPQTLGGTQYSWVSWSDGGQQSHDVTAGNIPVTYSAQFSGSCGYTISPTAQILPGRAGTGSVNVNAGSGCSWTAVSNNNWITITSGSSGSGNGVVNYSVAVNPANQKRTGTITIAGQTFTVKQNKGH